MPITSHALLTSTPYFNGPSWLLSSHRQQVKCLHVTTHENWEMSYIDYKYVSESILQTFCPAIAVTDQSDIHKLILIAFKWAGFFSVLLEHS